MSKWIYLSIALLLLLGCQKNTSVTQWVDPFIGTDGHGHTYPGPSWPFGMVQLSPDTRLSGWDGCSGYHYSDSLIYGFSHTHLSGTGASDYGDILLMPTVGPVNLQAIDTEHPGMGYSSHFTHNKEEAKPGYYRVMLEDDHVLAELTSSQRVGLHKYTFPKSLESNVILDLEHRDEVLSSYIKVVSEYEIEGLRRSKSWANDQYVYFVIRFNKPFKDYGLYLNNVKQNGSEVSGRKVKAHFSFSTKRREELLVKVALSAVSVEGARKNLEEEMPYWKFDKAVRRAGKAWEDILSRFEVVDQDQSKLRTFYTAIYHQYLNPNIYTDVDSMYRGRDMLVHKANNHEYYTLFSLWDTYRATHPLFTLMERKKTNDFIQTFLRQYEQSGILPVWELSANETGTMIGYHAVSVIADAYVKGIRDYDTDLALSAARNSAMQDHLGLRHYRKLGYIPSGQERESVSKTLEYAYDDWCIAVLADSLKQADIAQEFYHRSKYYQNLWDPETGFFRAKSDALWVHPFDPVEVNNHYTEANAWQYLFSVQHDIHGLAALMGGKDQLAHRLDELFSLPTETRGRNQLDITGMVGQYAQGNEPSHHIAYLYNYTNEPWKTQEKVSQICREFYTDQPDGLCGNEDCGQLSAWYIFSSLGFYPVTPGSDQYVFGSPQFEEVTLHYEDGLVMKIIAHNLTAENIYIKKVVLNGKSLNRNYITHNELIEGGQLEFFMSNQPVKSADSDRNSYPGHPYSSNQFIPVPYISSGTNPFDTQTLISLGCLDSLAEISYQFVNQASPGTSYFKEYQDTLKLTSSRKLRFYSSRDTISSAILEANFYELSRNRSVVQVSPYSGQYSAGGDLALIDQIRGARNFSTGAWQGFEGNDLEITVDLGFKQTVNRIGLSCLQDQESWVFMPSVVIYELSTDGENFKEVARVENDIDPAAQGTFIKEYTANIWKTARYVRARAINIGLCPDWHPGAGGKAWIFADELVIE